MQKHKENLFTVFFFTLPSFFLFFSFSSSFWFKIFLDEQMEDTNSIEYP